MSSNIFNRYKAKPTFAERKEPYNASEYIAKKKARYSFCSPNICNPNKNVYSQSNLLMLRTANKLAFYPCINEFDKTELYLNLFTKLQLDTNINVIDFNVNITNPPSQPYIDPSITNPYNFYNIDPSGNLFGNTICGLNNWENYIVPDINSNTNT